MGAPTRGSETRGDLAVERGHELVLDEIGLLDDPVRRLEPDPAAVQQRRRDGEPLGELDGRIDQARGAVPADAENRPRMHGRDVPRVLVTPEPTTGLLDQPVRPGDAPARERRLRALVEVDPAVGRRPAVEAGRQHRIRRRAVMAGRIVAGGDRFGGHAAHHTDGVRHQLDAAHFRRRGGGAEPIRRGVRRRHHTVITPLTCGALEACSRARWFSGWSISQGAVFLRTQCPPGCRRRSDLPGAIRPAAAPPDRAAPTGRSC